LYYTNKGIFMPKKTLHFCLYCGERADIGLHLECQVMLDKFRKDLAALPPKEKFKAFQAAERGHYGTVKKK
jgi:hypothetical protein